MKKYKNIALAIALCASWAILGACNEIDAPYLEKQGSVEADTTKKKVLIEEFTGFKCGNCPKAAEEAHRLKEMYGDKIILVSYHVGSFAVPDKIAPFTYDFRTVAGNEIQEPYKISSELGTPNGLINRSKYGSDLVMNQSLWEAAVNAELQKEADIKIKLTPAYSPATGVVNVAVDLEFLSEGGFGYNLCVLMVEDSVVQYQKYYGHDPEAIPNYVHNSVVRTSFNGSFGESLSPDIIAPNSKIKKAVAFTIPAGKNWRVNKLRIVAMVIDPANNYAVQQVEEAQLIK